MKENLTKKDIIWNYLSKAFSLFSGLITLPMILSFLTQDEIALNYIFLNIISFIALFDFGFSSQFSKNVAFAFGGANDLNAKGYQINEGNEINYGLIKAIITSAQHLYLRISVLMLIALVLLGTWYVYTVSNGFKLVDNAFCLWLTFVVVEFFDFYYRFYTPLMLGKGQIAEVNKIEILSSIAKIVVTIIFLLIGLRLWAVMIGMAAKVAIVRLLSYFDFYYKDGLDKYLNKIKVSSEESKIVLKKVWYNAKRTGIVQLASFATTQLGIFFIGIYLNPEKVASFGLLMQLVNIISGVSLSLGYSSIPLYSQFRASRNIKGLVDSFYFSTGMFYVIFLVGSLMLIVFIPHILPFIKSNAELPALSVVLIYLLNKFLEGQHCLCICCLSSKNVVYDFESATLIGILTVIVLYIAFHFFHIELLGLSIILLIVQLIYPNWKWPYEICKDWDITYPNLIKNSFFAVENRVISYFKRNESIFCH